MTEAHRKLDERYRSLRDTRRGPVFFIEHGLNDSARADLLDDVKEQLRLDGGLVQSRWVNAPLPLLVAATEVGYAYKGSGTDFWPVLEDTLDVRLSLADRQHIRDLFVTASELYRGAQPNKTPWARAFHLIAWPITHALVPLEFHRPLAHALAGLRENIAGLDEDALHRAIRVAAVAPPPRFSALLENRTVVNAVAKGLLGVDQAALCPETMQRIAADVTADHVARRGVAVALKRQRTTPPRKTRASARRGEEPPQAVGSLQLRRRNGAVTIEASLPQLQPDLQRELRRLLRRRRYAPKLWGLSGRIPSEQLLSGLPFAIKLSAIPSEDAELLPKLDELGLSSSLTAQLAAFTLDAAPPLLFAVSADGELGRRVRGPKISAHREYWLLSKPDEGPPERSPLGRVGPYDHYHLDPSNTADHAALEGLGFRVKYNLAAKLEGPPPLEPRPHPPTFAVGDQLLVVTPRVPPEGLLAELNGEEATLSDEDIAVVHTQLGAQALRLSGGGAAQTLDFAGAPPPQGRPIAACVIQPPTGEVTIQGLLRGSLSFLIESFAPLEGLSLTVEVEVGERRLHANAPIGALPCVVSAAHEPFVTLLKDDAAYDALTRSDSVTLRLSVGHLCSRTLTLERRVRSCWWSRDEDGALSLTSEVGDVSYGWVALTSPAAPITVDVAPPEGLTRLLVPAAVDVLEYGSAAEFTTLCVAPPRGALGPPAIPKPRLLRSRSDSGSGLGLDNLTRAYLRWSLAETTTALAAFRRHQVVSELERWLVEVCCGEEWARREAVVSGKGLWETLAEVCDESGLGTDAYIELSELERDQLRRLRAGTLREQLPDLWFKFSPPCELNDDDFEGLDGACACAYARLAKRYEGRGEIARATELSDADPGAPAEDWLKALTLTRERVKAAVSREPLVELLLPSNSVNALMALEPSILTLDELAEELASWAKDAKSAFAGSAPKHDTLKAIAALWVAPEVAIEGSWRDALSVLLIERSVARATRYLALRSRYQGEGGMVW